MLSPKGCLKPIQQLENNNPQGAIAALHWTCMSIPCKAPIHHWHMSDRCRCQGTMLGSQPVVSEPCDVYSLCGLLLLLHMQLRPLRCSSTSRARRWRAPSGGPSRRPSARTGPSRPQSRRKGEHPSYVKYTTQLSVRGYVLCCMGIGRLYKHESLRELEKA